MDAQCVIGRSRSGVSNGENGFLGEKVEGSVNSRAWGTHHFSRCLQRVKRVTTFKPPAVVQSVMTTNSHFKTAPVQAPVYPKGKADPRNVASIILCGGTGSQLFPLTARRATPAVPVGGAYRLIDIPLSNCINSHVNKIFVLTQFNSATLNRHINKTYNFGQSVNFGDGFVEVLAANQTSGEAGMNWFRGTADAVRQYTWVFEDARNKGIKNVLILAGDQLYRMDYMNFVQNHIDGNADITVSCVPVDESRATDFGLMKIDSRGKIIQFAEKPTGPELKAMEVDTTVIGLSPQEALQKPYIASMGVYVFKTEVLLNLLKTKYPTAHDFGSEIIPSALMDHNVNAYIFRDYWEDIGTIRSFYEANLALTEEIPKFKFYDQKAAIRTEPGFLPPSRMDSCRILESLVSHGCFLHEGCHIENSIVGERSRLDYGVELKDTLLMGADEYQTESEIAALLAEGKVPMGVGSHTKIRNCIIDKNAKIGRNVLIMNKDGVQEADRPEDGYYIRSGITVILEKATIPDGFVI